MKPGDHPDFFRFPAPAGQSRESTIRLDGEGRFWHDGTLVDHPRIEEALHSWISRHPDDGRHILTNGYDWTYFTVEDVPFFVQSVRLDGATGSLWLRLSSGDEVTPEGFSIGPEGALYAAVSVKGQPDEARFTRHAQIQLEPALVEQGGEIAIRSGDHLFSPAPRAR
jgi:hypothetical protein